MKWITIGDLHLKLHYLHGVETKDGNSRYLDLRDRLRQVTKLAIEEEIDFLVLAGDEYDAPGPNVPEDLKSDFVSDLIKPILDRGITIFALAGNHNYNLKMTGHDSIAKLSNNFHVFYKTTRIRYREQSLLFIPWMGELPRIKEDDIVFGHLEIKESKIGIFERKYSDGYSVRKFANCKGFYFAHFHKRQEFLQGKGLYVGSLIKITFDEREDTKGITVSTLGADNVLKNEFFELPDRTMIEWRLLEGSWSSHSTNGLAYCGSDPEYKIPHTKETFKNAIVKLVFVGTSLWFRTFDQQLLRKIFRDKFQISKLLVDKKYPKEMTGLSIEEIKEHTGSVLREAIHLYCKKLDKEAMEKIGVGLLEES